MVVVALKTRLAGHALLRVFVRLARDDQVIFGFVNRIRNSVRIHLAT